MCDHWSGFQEKSLMTYCGTCNIMGWCYVKVQAMYKSCIGHLFFVTDFKPKFQASTSSKGFFLVT